MASCIAARSAQRAAARIFDRSRSTLDDSRWAGTVNPPRRDRAGTVVPARILNLGNERYLRKRSLPQPFGIAFTHRSEVEEFTSDRHFHNRFEHRGRGRFGSGPFLSGVK